MDAKERQVLVAECRASGMTAKAWCEQKGIKYRQYVSWASKVNRKNQMVTEHGKQQWAAVTLPKEEQVAGRIKLNCGKWTIHADPGLNLALLADVLKVVNSLC
ncbi:IS66 family insertion sequence element accessory protein TnpA [Zhaonella formicivorans]|uniref:IS66 family insertion sequence element accessory protein TnpA n=1 Tax=Zhaonella formicivorans TaxID=2528593 RepID=UPI0010CE8C9D|nr:hypothetical protein [Zhaonella formicivorans]